MRPSVIPTGMGYVISFIDSDGSVPFTFEIDSIETTGWGLMATVTARTTIKSSRALAGGFLTTERVNLQGGRSRTDLARRMEALVPHPAGASRIDWDRIVDQLSLSVMDHERKPMVPVLLSEQSLPDSQRYLMPSLVPYGKATILYAAGGTGKGWFAAAVASAIQVGMPFLGMDTGQANVLYCDWESDEEDLTTRVHMTSRGLGLTKAAPVRYARFMSPIERHQADIDRLVREHDIGLVIIDSVGMAMAGGSGGDQATEAIRFFRALRSLGCSVIAIDHVSSEDQKRGSGAAKPYGSVFKWNSARNAFELTAQSDDGEEPVRLLLRHRKNNLGPKMRPASLIAEWGDDYMRFFREEVDEDSLYPALDERVIKVLSTGPTTAGPLTSLLNEERGPDRVNEYEVRQAVAALMAEGLLHVDTDGTIRKDPNEQIPFGLH